jgi:hypothetical protein
MAKGKGKGASTIRRRPAMAKGKGKGKGGKGKGKGVPYRASEPLDPNFETAYWHTLPRDIHQRIAAVAQFMCETESGWRFVLNAAIRIYREHGERFAEMEADAQGGEDVLMDVPNADSENPGNDEGKGKGKGKGFVPFSGRAYRLD